MFPRGLSLALLLPLSLCGADLVPRVRAAIAQGDFASGVKLIDEYRAASGVTPEMLEALSWLARGSLAAKKLDAAEQYAQQTYKLGVQQLKSRKLDDERRLPIAIGASIEVQAQVMAARGERADAVALLRKEIARFRNTSIHARLRKNLNLLTLEGKTAPPLEMTKWLGARPRPVSALKGSPVLLFFWAHWCGDCKYQAPILARLATEFPDLVIVGPTQTYGYVASGEEADPEVELKYIDQVREQFYRSVAMTVPVSQKNFANFGASTTPTLVLIDRAGIVRLYHPGRMTYEELSPLIRNVAASPRRGS